MPVDPRRRARSARGCALAVGLCSICSTVAAQTVPLDLDVPLDGVSAYQPDVPLPEDVIGHRVGTRHTRPDQLVAYVRALALASPRVAVAEHGTTYEGRPLVHAVVTAPANHARLEAIRAANLRLSDEAATVTDADLETMPAVVYLGYSIHGNEASGSEAALLTLYHLAAGQGPAVDAILDGAVVLIDPNLNPDGRDRFVSWANGNRGRVPTADPLDREHTEPWPGGRTNHYLFDLNRDWLPVRHPESRGRLALFHHWRPQLLTDHHEMGPDATFFFQPGIPSRTNPLTPERNTRLTGMVTAHAARALDGLGSLYYSQETFDDFYYGKGSTYPDLNGAVGILFEQARTRALLSETQFGVLSYAFGIRNQFVASLATLEAVAALRQELLRNQRAFYREAPEIARRHPADAFVIDLGDRRTRAQELLGLLQRHRIVAHELARPVEAGGRRFEPGAAAVVPLDQPQVRLLQTLMEPVTTFRDSLFYDVSTWTMPPAFGVTVEALPDARGAVGPPMAPVTPDGGELRGGTSPYAYVMEWNRYFAPRALHRFQAAGVRPTLLFEPFEADVAGARHRFGRGAVVVPVVGRDAERSPTPDTVHELVRAAVREDHVVIHALQSGLTPEGIDLGSAAGRVLEPPRVALLSGTGTSAYQVGEVWHLLSERMAVPVSLVDIDRIADADLSRYNTIVMAGVCDDAAARHACHDIPPDASERLAAWVREGGLLVATTTSVRWVIQQGLVEERFRKPAEPPAAVRYADLAAATGSQLVRGAIVDATVDDTHPLAYGYGTRVALFRTTTDVLEPSTTAAANVALYTDAPLRSGYLSAEREAALRGGAAVIARPVERGRVVLLADDPSFRAFWYGTDGLLLNAVFLGRVF